MTTDPKEQPVLLTEGSFANEDAENPPTEQQGRLENSETPAAAAPAASPVDASSSIPSRPVTAPDPSPVQVQDVERRVLQAVSNSPLPGEDQDDPLLAMETLSEKLNNAPSEAGDGLEDEYVAPPEDPYMRAVNYMEKHKVMQIFQKLTAEIVYHRPPDPLEHMLLELNKMKKERDDMIESIIAASATPK